jgi:dihydrofolate reductase
MRRLIVSAWMTLDGVFDANNMHQWFIPFDSVERQEYIKEGILSADALLLGRVTYEMLAPYWSALKNNEMGVAGKLNSVPKFVVSSALKNAEWNNSSIIRGNLAEAVGRMKKEPGNEIQIEGSGTLVRSLMETGLIDEYRLLIHPVIMGAGKRFFGDGAAIGKLELVENRKLSLGVVLLRYAVKK